MPTMNEVISDLPTNSLMANKQRIKLEPEQASLTPFPPGCTVVVMDRARVECSGEVSSVYVSFARNSGSCDNSYQIVSESVGGAACTRVVPGSELRYAIDCPIQISPPDQNQTIDGVIKGFEIQEGSESSFVYTVEVLKYGDEIRGERAYRHRGISPERIHFRPTTTARTHYFDDGKTSVISFDENSTSSKDDPEGRDATSSSREFSILSSPQRSRESRSGSKFSRPEIHIDTTFSNSPRPQGNTSSPYLIQDNNQFSSPYNGTGYQNCVPLASPIPNKFLGDMEKYKNSSIVEFSALVNFPSNGRNPSLPEGTKTCVMCSSVCPTSLKKKDGTSPHCAGTVIIPNQNKGLCTKCDVQIWVLRENGNQIKWCKGCKNFQHWAGFGEKGGATKCVRCRDRQREKYAASKLEKESKRKAQQAHLSPNAKKFCP
jgi:hypothetical protein